MKKTWLGSAIIVCAFAFGAPQAGAEEVTLKGAMFIKSTKSLFREVFDKFVAEVNAKGKGQIKFGPVLGPEAIPDREMPNALSTGVIDVVGLPPAYYRGILIEGDALQLATVSPATQRKNGAIDYIQKQYHAAGWHFLAQYGYDVQFHLFLNKPVATMADFKGMRLRTTPTYRKFFENLGAIQVETSRGEIYTAMERGVVNGYANPLSEVAPGGWAQVTKYLVDPGFYHAIVTITMNLKKWESLTKAQQAILTAAAHDVETRLATDFAAKDRAAGKELVAKGMKVITLKGDEGKKFVNLALDSYWGLLEKDRPDSMKILRPLLSAK
jgi:TRAP-type transport system periplasmic protein